MDVARKDYNIIYLLQCIYIYFSPTSLPVIEIVVLFHFLLCGSFHYCLFN